MEYIETRPDSYQTRTRRPPSPELSLPPTTSARLRPSTAYPSFSTPTTAPSQFLNLEYTTTVVDFFRKLLPWLDGMMDADEAYFKQHGEPLFVSLFMGELLSNSMYPQSLITW
jgi:hypothetical protein